MPTVRVFQNGQLLGIEEAPPPPLVDISRRQFFQALAKPGYEILTEEEAESALDGVIPAPLVNLINNLPPEVDRFDVRMLVKGAGMFERWHPITVMLAAAWQWDEAETDAFWRFAASL